jgi:hypothetical protein
MVAALNTVMQAGKPADDKAVVTCQRYFCRFGCFAICSVSYFVDFSRDDAVSSAALSVPLSLILKR